MPKILIHIECYLLVSEHFKSHSLYADHCFKSFNQQTSAREKDGHRKQPLLLK